jgi:hypothetical protein
MFVSNIAVLKRLFLVLCDLQYLDGRRRRSQGASERTRHTLSPVAEPCINFWQSRPTDGQLPIPSLAYYPPWRPSRCLLRSPSSCWASAPYVSNKWLPRAALLSPCQVTKARAATLHLPHGPVPLPIFMATQGSLKGLTPDQLEDQGCRLCLNNTYHLYGPSPRRVGDGLH